NCALEPSGELLIGWDTMNRGGARLRRALIFCLSEIRARRSLAPPFMVPMPDEKVVECLSGGGIPTQSQPVAPNQHAECRRARRLFVWVQEIIVERPVACRGIVIGARAFPKAGGDSAVKQYDHGAVVGQGVAAPVFKKPREVFHPAAVGDGAGLEDARQEPGVDGGAAC